MQVVRTAPADNQPHIRRFRKTLAATAVILGMPTATAVPDAASAASPYERGPNPTAASVAAVTGPFAIASVQVPRGNDVGEPRGLHHFQRVRPYPST